MRDAVLGRRAAEDLGHGGNVPALRPVVGEGREVERLRLREAAPDDLEVLLHHAPAEVTELLLRLREDAREETFLVEVVLLDERGGAEEGAHEGRALHAVTQVRVRRDLGRDLERVERPDADLPLADLALRGPRERVPELLRRETALDHEHAALREAGERVGVPEHVRSGERTTSTCLSSQFVRTGSLASVA